VPARQELRRGHGPRRREDVVPKVLRRKQRTEPPAAVDRRVERRRLAHDQGEGVDEVLERGAVGERVVVSEPEEHAVVELGDLDGEQGELVTVVVDGVIKGKE
jgi:hypothetical protein